MNIEKVGQNIDEIRKERGWSKSELAHRMGMNSEPGVFKHIATGGMSVRYLAKYAEVLGCTIADITEGVTDPKDFHLDTDITAYYPYNLAVAVGGLESDLNRDPESKVKAMDILHSIYIPGMMKSLTDLTDREQKILYMRFNNHMTLEQIGRKHNITRERVRQCVAKGLRKLRHPTRCCFVKYGKEGGAFFNELKALKQEYHDLSEKYDTLCAMVEEKEKEVLAIAHDNSSPKVFIDCYQYEETDAAKLDLSVRSYNCLLRANAVHIDDIVDLLKTGKIIRLRNLGKQSLIEILTAVRDKFGIDCFDYYTEKFVYKGEIQSA